jgi:hypothetical protein
MQKSLNLILSLVILVQSFGFNLYSLAQFDDLWSHYQEHKIEYGYNLLTFLDLHYGSQQQDHEHEHPEHQDLPSQQNLHMHYTFFVEIISSEFYLDIPFEEAKHNFGYSSLFTSLLETDILQPPKPLA